MATVTSTTDSIRDWYPYNSADALATVTLTTDNTGHWYPYNREKYIPEKDFLEGFKTWMKSTNQQAKPDKSLPEGVEEMYLYRVWLVYGENRKQPYVLRVGEVIAKDEESAKIKSGIMKHVDPDWDNDYLTVFAEQVCSVKIKAKPSEVMNV